MVGLKEGRREKGHSQICNLVLQINSSFLVRFSCLTSSLQGPGPRAGVECSCWPLLLAPSCSSSGGGGQRDG